MVDTKPNVWDELSRRFYGADREYLKRVVLTQCYGGETDPWLDYLVRAELHQLEEEGMFNGVRR
jgi:hypothetical protein